MKTRANNSRKVQWLLKHPDVWEGEGETPEARRQMSEKIFEAMQKARLFSKRTLCADVNIEKLISQARFIRRMEQQQPKPESN